MTNTEISQYESDHLILLVGGNPLPNAVAGKLLAAPAATIWLLHSNGADGGPSTKKTAENLELFLRAKNPDWNIKLEPIPSSNNVGIENRLGEILGNIPAGNSVGLHYTGGTKSMSVHAYRALEKTLASSHPRPIFSYLDPRQLALRIDGHGTEGSQLFFINKTDQLREKVAMTNLDDLAALHDYEPAPPNTETWAESNAVKNLAKAMVKIHANPKARIAWTKLRGQWREVPKEQDFPLPSSEDFPSLQPLIDAFDQLCGGPGAATPNLVARKLRPDEPNPTLRSCSKWFLGVWLELYAATSFLDMSNQQLLDYAGTNLFYRNRSQKSDKFELDIAAITGYQLFAISCIATPNKPQAKEHFLEVYVRARQLGGDEAHAGLICLVENQLELEHEIKNSWDAEGKIKVFGLSQLQALSQNLTNWLSQGTR